MLPIFRDMINYLYVSYLHPTSSSKNQTFPAADSIASMFSLIHEGQDLTRVLFFQLFPRQFANRSSSSINPVQKRTKKQVFLIQICIFFKSTRPRVRIWRKFHSNAFSLLIYPRTNRDFISMQNNSLLAPSVESVCMVTGRKSRRTYIYSSFFLHTLLIFPQPCHPTHPCFQP